MKEHLSHSKFEYCTSTLTTRSLQPLKLAKLYSPISSKLKRQHTLTLDNIAGLEIRECPLIYSPNNLIHPLKIVTPLKQNLTNID